MFTPIAFDDFVARTGFNTASTADLWGGARVLVSLRAISRVTAIHAMSTEYLDGLLEHVPLVGDAGVTPYRDCCIRLYRIDPKQLRVGQTFVQRGKCLAILENTPNLFHDFTVTTGLAKLTAHVIIGEDEHGVLCAAHYVPPIVEQHCHNMVVLDGMHRNFLSRSIGSTMESVVIQNPTAPFPARWHNWRQVAMVDAKPPPDQRFFDLRPELFRDLKHVGIDG